MRATVRARLAGLLAFLFARIAQRLDNEQLGGALAQIQVERLVNVGRKAVVV